MYCRDFTLIIDCIGCLHGARPKLEGGDILIITGDLTAMDTVIQHFDVLAWLQEQSYRKKILVSGNHDMFLEKNPDFYKDTNIDHLCDSGTEFEGIKIWGSPWTSSFKGINPHCTAYTVPMGSHVEDRLMESWDKIPHNTDILVTHGPPSGILDTMPQRQYGFSFRVGSKSLYAWLKFLGKPRLHVFSHIHESYGKTENLPSHGDKMMISVNCSIMNERYKPVNAPIRIILGDADFPNNG
jgi:Icc-related predicted phosphoesterase